MITIMITEYIKDILDTYYHKWLTLEFTQLSLHCLFFPADLQIIECVNVCDSV